MNKFRILNKNKFEISPNTNMISRLQEVRGNKKRVISGMDQNGASIEGFVCNDNGTNFQYETITEPSNALN